jgi:platelet-activating factor acetylhydrolase
MSEDHGQDPPPLGSEHTSKVPNAKRPKPRPPQGFRDKSFVPGKSLPTYTGPYSVGTFEIECAAREPRKFSHISRKGQPALKLETVLMTVYYPAALETHDPLRRNHHMSRELWLGRPRLGMVAGYSRFISIPPALTWPFFVPVLFTKLPAYRNAGIARHWAPAVDTKSGGVHIKTEHGEEPGGLGTEEPTFPLIVFSHGLGGTRTMYSSICGEFASYGFVVCSVEHRDGSGPRTYINHTNAEDERGEQRKQDAHVDYLFPKDNPFDTSPINDKGVDVELRGAQIDLRMAEIEEAYEILRLINNGDGQKVAEKNFRREGFVGSSSHGLDGVRASHSRHW